MKPIQKTLSMRLLTLRRQYGVSAYQIADMLGIAPQTYSGYERGRHTPSIEMLVWLANLYGVSLDYLVGRDGYADDK